MCGRPTGHRPEHDLLAYLRLHERNSRRPGRVRRWRAWADWVQARVEADTDTPPPDAEPSR